MKLHEATAQARTHQYRAPCCLPRRSSASAFRHVPRKTLYLSNLMQQTRRTFFSAHGCHTNLELVYLQHLNVHRKLRRSPHQRARSHRTSEHLPCGWFALSDCRTCRDWDHPLHHQTCCVAHSHQSQACSGTVSPLTPRASIITRLAHKWAIRGVISTRVQHTNQHSIENTELPTRSVQHHGSRSPSGATRCPYRGYRSF